MLLQSTLAAGTTLDPNRPAVVHPGRSMLTYAQLVMLSDRFALRLLRSGVQRGDRVGLYLHKSVDAIAAIFGVLKCGAAYVPVDPDAPVERCAYVLNDCAVRAVLCDESLAAPLRAQLASLGLDPVLLPLHEGAEGVRLQALLEDEPAGTLPHEHEPAEASADRLAYILYTSGSTGRPKGVMLSHRAALGFVDWCSDTFRPRAEDRFSSHAPLHFDLSILDIFVPLKHGASVILIDEPTGKDPLTLAALIAEQRITVWYSTPSILNLLAQHGKLGRHRYDALRLVLFAGEVFPVPQLRALQSHWPERRYFNLYGPTETNVCTYYEIPGAIPAERDDPFPIGRTCEHLRTRVVDGDRDLPRGAEGELVVAGDGVMSGYWNLPELNARAFLTDESGRWYRTGDVVSVDAAGDYIFHGRRDRMVKRRGYRIELGEIEAGLAKHPAVMEVAVVAFDDGGRGTRIQAFLGLREAPPPSIIDMKLYSASALPRYMIPDIFSFVDVLPRTSTDKIDYRRLAEQAQPAR